MSLHSLSPLYRRDFRYTLPSLKLLFHGQNIFCPLDVIMEEMPVKNVKNVPVTLIGPPSLVRPADWCGCTFNERDSHLQLTTKSSFTKIPSNQVGRFGQCIALVIHQGPDPLNGEQQPCGAFLRVRA